MRKPTEGEVQVTIEKITPKIADAYLDQNTHNRNLRLGHVDEISRDMSSGSFMLNGDAIRFSDTGVLLDGQHRLAACVKSGITFETVVIRGLPDETQRTMDSGSKRTAGDTLNLYGVHHANNVSAAIKTIYGIRSGNLQRELVTKEEVFRFYEKNNDISYWASYAHKSFPKMSSLLTATSFIMSKKYGDDMSRSFVDVFKSGIPSMERCAAHAVRERLIKISQSNLKMSPNDRVKLVVHGGLSFANGKPLSILRVPEKIKCPWIDDLFP